MGKNRNFARKKMEKVMRKVVLSAMLAAGMLTACNIGERKTVGKNNKIMNKLTLVEAWDKVFPLSKNVKHRKVTFETPRLPLALPKRPSTVPSPYAAHSVP